MTQSFCDLVNYTRLNHFSTILSHFCNIVSHFAIVIQSFTTVLDHFIYSVVIPDFANKTKYSSYVCLGFNHSTHTDKKCSQIIKCHE
jgi:hypothetical protein